MIYKDETLSRFVIKVIMPGVELINVPGFVVCRFSEQGKETFLRELIYPENLFVEFEKRLIEKFGDEGAKILYSAGKKFCWNYSELSQFPQISKCSEKEMEEFIEQFIMYAEATSFGKMEHTTNLKIKEFNIFLGDYMVCPHNGLGYLFTWGSICGFWAYIMEDKKIEGAQIKCKGRGDEKCHVICAPENVLLERNIKFFEENLEDLKIDADLFLKSIEINKIRKTQFAKISFEDLIDSGIFKYSEGVITYRDERYFVSESHVVYFLEMELKKLEGAEDVLFDSAFDHGKKIAEEQKEQNYSKFITDYMSVLGWGDILIREDKETFSIFSNYFPWNQFYGKVNYVLYRGMLSGLLSGFIGKEIRLKNYTQTLVGDVFNVKVY